MENVKNEQGYVGDPTHVMCKFRLSCLGLKMLLGGLVIGFYVLCVRRPLVPFDETNVVSFTSIDLILKRIQFVRFHPFLSPKHATAELRCWLIDVKRFLGACIFFSEKQTRVKPIIIVDLCCKNARALRWNIACKLSRARVFCVRPFFCFCFSVSRRKIGADSYGFDEARHFTFFFFENKPC